MRYFFSVLLSFLCILAVGQDKRRLLDSLFETLYQQGRFNGNVLIAENGSILYEKSFGMARPGDALSDSSVFELASCSKAFTAMGIALLHQQHLVNYDDSLSRYIPELKFYPKVTVEQLIHHSSGLPDYTELLDKWWDHTKVATNIDVIQLLVRYKPQMIFSPGSSYEYSNTGYVLLATIIERISGNSFSEFLKNRLLAPLRMHNSMVYPDSSNGLNLVSGYMQKENKIYPGTSNTAVQPYTDYERGIVGDAGVQSSARDLFILDRALRGTGIFSRQELKQLFSRGILNSGQTVAYAFGWEIDSNRLQGKVASHTGGWRGYSCYVERDLDQDKTIILLQNMDRGVTPAIAIRRILYNQPLHPKVVAVPEAILSQYTGDYILSSTFKITISKQGTQLKAFAPEYGLLDIYPENTSHFFLHGVDAELEFERDSNGKVCKLIIDHQGEHQEAIKID